MRWLILALFLGLSSCARGPISRAPSSWDTCYNILKRLLDETRKTTEIVPSSFDRVSSLVELDSLYKNDSMFDWQARLTQQEIIEANNKTLELLNSATVPQGVKTFDEDTVDHITKGQAKKLFDDMMESPCVKRIGLYERPGADIGYCFGKATLVHMTALIRGVNPHSIKKIWIVGETTNWWGHHVAGLVRGPNGKWWVIDRDAGQVMTAKSWINAFGASKKDKELMIFVTNPERFGPENSKTYNTFDLFNTPADKLENYRPSKDYYKGFFRDLFKWLDKNPNLGRF